MGSRGVVDTGPAMGNTATRNRQGLIVANVWRLKGRMGLERLEQGPNS